MNAERHLRSQFAFSCDIMEFYPSIHSSRVYRLFAKIQGCSPDVARLLTRLCTYRYHLALGLITSPLLADQFLTIDETLLREGDIDADGHVGYGDLLRLLTAWGECPAAPVVCPADLNGSGHVSAADLLKMLTSWG